jgi:hypothetical protein
MADNREGLKALGDLLLPDSRNTFFRKINLETGKDEAFTIEDHYSLIERYAVNDRVPEKVRIQYDVARNLYLYAWFEFRFHNVAEAKVLTVLEFAIKQRIGVQNLKLYVKQREEKHLQLTNKKIRIPNGLKTLIEYCRDYQLIHNQGFSAWHRHAKVQAQKAAEYERLEWATAEFKRTGQSEIVLPEIVIPDLPPDVNYDHIQHLIKHVNRVRNEYAHGSSMLHKQVLSSFEMVSEFINQIYTNSDEQTL